MRSARGYASGAVLRRERYGLEANMHLTCTNQEAEKVCARNTPLAFRRLAASGNAMRGHNLMAGLPPPLVSSSCSEWKRDARHLLCGGEDDRLWRAFAASCASGESCSVDDFEVVGGISLSESPSEAAWCSI